MKFVDGQARVHPELVARFELEAKVEAQLRSPHVVQVFDHGIWQGIPYIAMEYLEGEALADRLYRLGHLDPEVTYRIVAHVARALTVAHAHGIVHRDLKPENIFLVPGDDGEVIKVLDFGVAKFSTGWSVSRVTKTGLLVGTPLYMSPEQARGTREIDGRADLWSLAVIAYQCLTGSLPFLSEGLGDLLAKIMFDPIPRPSDAMPNLPAEIDGWWILASSRDLDSRFQTAKELADAFGAALGVKHIIPISDIPVGLHADRLSIGNITVSEPPAAEEPAALPLQPWTPAWILDWVSGNRLLAAAAVGGLVVLLGLLLARGSSDHPHPSETNAAAAPAPTVSPHEVPAAEPREPQEHKDPRPTPDGPNRSGIRTDDLPSVRGATNPGGPESTASPRASEGAPRRAMPPSKGSAPKNGAPPKVDFGI